MIPEGAQVKIGFLGQEPRPRGPMEEVCELPNGATLYRQTDEAGGHLYWSDEIDGGVFVWDTTSVAPSTLTAAVTEEWRRRIAEQREKRRAELSP